MTTEHNNINYNDLSELVNTAPAELCQACVGMLHSRYGESFASYSEVAAMMNNVSYARATLFYSGTYGAEILSFFAGARAQRLLTPFAVKDALEPQSPVSPDAELVEELRKGIFDVELMIQTTQVTDGPRNDKERVEQAERHALVGRLAKIRRALYRSKDVIEHLEA